MCGRGWIFLNISVDFVYVYLCETTHVSEAVVFLCGLLSLLCFVVGGLWSRLE